MLNKSYPIATMGSGLVRCCQHGGTTSIQEINLQDSIVARQARFALIVRSSAPYRREVAQPDAWSSRSGPPRRVRSGPSASRPRVRRRRKSPENISWCGRRSDATGSSRPISGTTANRHAQISVIVPTSPTFQRTASRRRVTPSKSVTAAITRNSRINRSLDLEIHRRCFPAVLFHLILDLLPFIERAQSSLLDRGDMDEHVFAACLRLDKSITLGRIEPLHGTTRHFDLPSNDLGVILF